MNIQLKEEDNEIFISSTGKISSNTHIVPECWILCPQKLDLCSLVQSTIYLSSGYEKKTGHSPNL